MPRWVIGRKNLALVLLVALPAATTGRLALDAAWDMSTAIDIEAEHTACDVPAHDHRICGLILSSPWTLPPVTAAVRIALPAAEASDHRTTVPVGSDPDLLRLPRSPPLS